MNRKSRERGDLFTQLGLDRTQHAGNAIHRQAVSNVEIQLKHRRAN